MAPRVTAPRQVRAGTRIARRTGAALDALWRTLRRPWLLVTLILLLLALLVAARILPQMPGQAQEDPASAQRWLNAEADAWQRGGSLLRALGLFSALQSPLFYALAGAVAMLSAIHLAEAVRFVRLPGRLRALLDASVTANPLPVLSPETVYRRRTTVAMAQAQTAAAISTWLTQSLGANVERTQIALPVPEDQELGEIRLLVQRRAQLVWLRPLLPAALLLSTAVLWINALWGWDVRPETLAPGAQVIYAPHAVKLAYEVVNETTGAASALISGTVAGMPVQFDPSNPGQHTPGLRVAVSPSASALWINTQDPVLALPGEDETRRSVGLIFPQPGSEQLVVLPRDNAGLRLVRLGGENAGEFLVEVFAEDAVQPVERVQMNSALTVTVPTEDSALRLALTPMPGIDLEVRRSPGEWLVWPALFLAIAGLAGVWLRPSYAIAQIREWPVGRSVVTLQSSERLPAELPLREAIARQEGNPTPDS